MTWICLSPCPPLTRKNNHPHNNSWNVNDICLFPSICNTNEVLGARSGVIYRLTIRDGEGSLDRQTQIAGGLDQTEGKKEHNRSTHNKVMQDSEIRTRKHPLSLKRQRFWIFRKKSTNMLMEPTFSLIPTLVGKKLSTCHLICVAGSPPPTHDPGRAGQDLFA